MLFPYKNRYFDNNYLHFSKQDRFFSILLALFILALPFTALLPHGRVFLLLSLFLFLYAAWRTGYRLPPPDAEKTLLSCFFATVAAGLFKAGAFLPTVCALSWLFAALLSSLLRVREAQISRLLTLLGACLGGVALWETACGKAAALWSDASRFGALNRAALPFGNPNLLGAFLAPCAVLALGELFRARTKLLPSLCLALSLSGLMLTYSRGAWLGFLAGALLVLFPILRRKTPKALALLPFSSVLKRFASILSPDSSVCYRFSLWRSVGRVSPPRLLCGVGEGKEALYALLSPYMAAGLEKVEHTHSLYLHLLTAEGLLGLAFFLAFLFLFFKRHRASAISGALLSLLVFGIFDDPLYSGQIGVLFWLLVNVR